MNAHTWKTSKQHRAKSLKQKALVCDKGRTKEALPGFTHPTPTLGMFLKSGSRFSLVHLSKTDQQAQCTLIYGLQIHSSK